MVAGCTAAQRDRRKPIRLTAADSIEAGAGDREVARLLRWGLAL